MKLAASPSGSGVDPCCCEEGCCMYPAAQLGIDFIEGDLPAAVTVNGTSRSRSGSAYGNTTNGVIWESGVWAVYVAGVRSTQACLIKAGIVEDDFDDSYRLNFNVSFLFIVDGDPTITLESTAESLTLKRIGLCEWEGIMEGVAMSINDEDGGFVVLQFILTAPSDSTDVRWQIYFESIVPSAFTGAGWNKPGPHDTPIGSYADWAVEAI